MRMQVAVLLGCLCVMAERGVCATSFLSYTGNLANPEDVFETTFSISVTSNIEILTWSFGGGTDRAGSVIAPGGFDPLVALFSGPPATASIVTIAGNPAADADTLSNPPISYTGNCPPAGMVTIGTGTGNAVCGDDHMQVLGLAAGTYTLVLTDANYVPFAVNPGPPLSTLLSDGFVDLTGGVFQTCNTTGDGTFCITPSSAFAVDILDLSCSVDHPGCSGLSTPEPASSALLGLGLIALGAFKFRNKNGIAPRELSREGA